MGTLGSIHIKYISNNINIPWLLKKPVIYNIPVQSDVKHNVMIV